MSRPSRVPGMRATTSARIPLCSLHLASCVRVDGNFVCPICMAENEPALAILMPNRRARRAVMQS